MTVMATYHTDIWCSGKYLAFSARGPMFESGVGNSYCVRSAFLTFFIVGGAWVWVFPPLQCCTVLCATLQAANGDSLSIYELSSRQFCFLLSVSISQN